MGGGRARSLVGLAFLAASVLAAPAAGQRFLVHRYGVPEGLPDNTVYDVAEAPDGTLWALTFRGPARHDGVRWAAGPPLPTRGALTGGQLGVDEGGGLWALVRAGEPALFRLEGERWRRVSLPPAVRGSRQLRLAVRGGGPGAEAAVAAAGAGLFVWAERSGRWRAVSAGDGLPSAEVVGVARWRGGWLAACAEGLAAVDGAGVRPVWPAAPGERVAAAAVDRPGVAWALTSRGLLRLDAAGPERVAALPPGFRPRYGAFLVPAPPDAVWFGTQQLLWYLDLVTGEVAPAGAGNGLPGGGLGGGCVDAEGNVWLATDRGIGKVASMRFAVWDRDHGLAGDEVTALAEPVPGRLVVGHVGWLSMGSPGAWRRLPVPGEPGSPEALRRVMDLEPDGRGGVWVGAIRAGLLHLDGSGRLRRLAPGRGLAVMALARSRRGLWAGGSEGVRLWTSAGYRPAPWGEGPEHVRRLLARDDGSLVVATARGLYVARGATLEEAAQPEDPAFRDGFALLPDGDGVLVGTRGGLLRLVGLRAEPVGGPVAGLAPVFSLVRAPDGAVWIGTGRGAVRWDGDGVRRYTPWDGFSSWECNRDAALVDASGRLWLGGEGGLALYRPGHDRPPPPPRVAVVGAASEAGALAGSGELRTGLAPPWIEFRYRVLSFADERRTGVEGFLEGLEEGWRRLDPAQRAVRYHRPPPGRYRFHLRAANAAGVMSEEAVSVPVVVPRPPWAAWWFWALVALLGAAAGVGLAWTVMRARAAARLEAEVAARTAELAESEARYRALFAGAADPLLIVDPSLGAVLEANRTARELLGPEAERLDRGPLPIARVRWLEEALTRTGSPVEDTVEAPLPSGERRRYALLAHPIALAGRSVRLLRLRDVTDRERLMEERERRNRIESLGLLAGGIAHDFNNMLAAARGNLDLARLRLGDPEGVEAALDAAAAALARGRDLTSRLLMFAKGGAPVKELTDLGELIAETARFVMSGSACRLDLHIEPGLWAAEVDPGQLAQVVSNLVLNAVQAMPGGGTVRVRARNVERPEGPAVAVVVEDEGPGVPPELRSRIFDPYFTTKPGGTGLGLAAAAAAVRAHGGTLSVGEAPGGGAAFTVVLPAAPGARPGATGPEREPEAAPGTALVMDDQADVRELLAELLAALGWEVTAVAHGEAAVAAYREALRAGRPPDVVLLDLTVPGGMGGIETLRALRELDPGVRAVAVSGYSADGAVADPARHGFAAGIGKPFTVDALRAALARARRRS